MSRAGLAGRGALVVALLVTSACGSCRDAGSGSEESARAEAEGREPAAGSVRVLLDGEVIDTLAPSELSKARALRDLLPPKARSGKDWNRVNATGPDSRAIRLPGFGERMPEARVLLERKGDGVGVEVVPNVEKELPAQVAGIAGQPIASLERVEKLEVWTQAVEHEGGSAKRKSLTVRVDGRERATIQPDELDALGAKSEGSPRRGASLRAVLATVTDLDRIEAVTLRTRTDETARIERSELTGQEVFTLRHNRRGMLRYERFPDGDSRRRTEGLRDVTALELALADPPDRDAPDAGEE